MDAEAFAAGSGTFQEKMAQRRMEALCHLEYFRELYGGYRCRPKHFSTKAKVSSMLLFSSRTITWKPEWRKKS